MAAGLQEISRVVPIAATESEDVFRFGLSDIEFRLVTTDDAWLRVAYDLLLSGFDANVLDPYERYVEWLGLNERGQHLFPFLMMVAFVRDGPTAHVLGVISGNVMRTGDYLTDDQAPPEEVCFFAIGHQITSPELRKAGIKGVGSRLWQAAHDVARTWARNLDGVLRYSVLEAESDSLGFWTKMGYLWPQGVPYWQPPLEFDSQGIFVHPEVPEILMLHPLEGAVPTRSAESCFAKLSPPST